VRVDLPVALKKSEHNRFLAHAAPPFSLDSPGVKATLVALCFTHFDPLNFGAMPIDNRPPRKSAWFCYVILHNIVQYENIYIGENRENKDSS
jgi:hypothetical protein